MPLKPFITLCLLLIGTLASPAVSYESANVNPPRLPREFRGLWIATVANIDWPSKPGLSTAAQKAELISILDRAEKLNLNAVIFQVRPACDAFYASQIEPWSEYLTGAMGKAPEPFYDPLSFAIEEAHKRGLELHAWFNPYRALHKSHAGSVSADHISKRHPEFVKSYGQYLWLDPGEREVQDYSLSVVMDVVKRYDIDGVHFDDYFYPDPAEANKAFPDNPSWKKFGAKSGLPLDDWRRENVNDFIERVYRSIKAAKPWVKFGVSPHGIWRPGNPSSIRGFDAYAKISADSRKWLANGWLDYFSPQLYWTIDSKEQSFPVLLKWWAEQNVKQRHLWPGLSVAYAARPSWDADEIPKQIQITRDRSDVTGYILYNTSSLLANKSLLDRLQRKVQPTKALIPASPWLGKTALPKPGASVSGNPESLKLNWKIEGAAPVQWWAVQTKSQGKWNLEILPGETLSMNPGVADAIAVTAIDRFGNASSPAMLQARKATSRERIPQHRKW